MMQIKFILDLKPKIKSFKSALVVKKKKKNFLDKVRETFLSLVVYHFPLTWK